MKQKKDKLTHFTEEHITSEELFINRRKIVSQLGLSLGTALAGQFLPASVAIASAGSANAISSRDKSNLTNSSCHNSSVLIKNQLNLKPNSWDEITRYNNYYEFTTNKEVVFILAKELKTNPWTLTIEGEVKNNIILDIESLNNKFGIEDRIYPLRCVEGWSMVIPWQGFSLCKLLDLVQPTSDAKFIEFVSLHRPAEMIGQRQSSLDWPYREALRLDEAYNPLTFMATGMYGKSIPAQNGAPLRLVVPWKYGFKSAKAITHIRLLKEQPQTSWNLAAASEYGFYANVNPNIAHPRWSQKRENRIGELRKKPTLLFNGYAEQVAHLYKGMDLSVYY